MQKFTAIAARRDYQSDLMLLAMPADYWPLQSASALAVRHASGLSLRLSMLPILCRSSECVSGQKKHEVMRSTQRIPWGNILHAERLHTYTSSGLRAGVVQSSV